MLLAAGLGERMRPLTQDRPKPALAVLGRPLAVQNLRRMRDAGIQNAVVNLHYRPEVLRELLGEGGSCLPRVRFTEEDPILGTGGGIRHARELLRGAGPFLVHNSDFLSDIDFNLLLESHLAGGFLATLALVPARPGYSAVDVDDRSRVVSIAGRPDVAPEKVVGSYLFSGCHVLDESLLERLPGGGPSNIVTDLYQPLAGEGRLGAYFHPGFWWEFGSPEAFLEGQLRLLDLEERERSAIADHDPIRALGGSERVSVGPGVEVDGCVRIDGRCSLAMAVRVCAGSRLADSIVMDESWIGPECRLTRCIVGPQTELPAGFEARDVVICPDLDPKSTLGEGIERRDGLLIRPLGTR